MDIWDAPGSHLSDGRRAGELSAITEQYGESFFTDLSAASIYVLLSEGIYLYAVPGYLSYTEIRQE